MIPHTARRAGPSIAGMSGTSPRPLATTGHQRPSLLAMTVISWLYLVLLTAGHRGHLKCAGRGVDLRDGQLIEVTVTPVNKAP